jgi:hypothetical protein
VKGRTVKNLIKVLNEKGYKNLVAEVMSQEYGISNVLGHLANDLLNNKFNLARKFSLLIDESSISSRGCTFIVSDEDANTHGRLMAEMVMESAHGEIIYRWKSFKTAEDFEKEALQTTLINFLKRNDIILDFIYYEGPYERVMDIVSVMKKEVRTYANNLVQAIKIYLR